MSDVYSGNKPSTIKRALISVSDKTGVADFAKMLHETYKVEILSTGGTFEHLQEAGIPVREVADVTGFPEIMGGRVKTLHPRIHGGLLGKQSDPDHKKAMEEHNIPAIDMLVVNLYPFVATVKSDASFDTCIENIDIGGPAMIRAAAKNHDYVSVITSPEDYKFVLDLMATHGGKIPQKNRRDLAENAFARTAAYDSAIAAWFAEENEDHTPYRTAIYGRLKQKLRYGENPHQTAALYYDDTNRPGVINASQLQGKELSYNNINDTDAAFELVSEFKRPAVAIIKHANPCGVSIGEDVLHAYDKALLCDPISAYGGIVALNRPLDAKTATQIIKTFCEVIIAPSIEAEASRILEPRKNLRVLTTGAMADPSAQRKFVKSIAGGFLIQDADNGVVDKVELNVVTEREPSEQELDDLLFAFKVCKHVKSNAIIYAKNGATTGVGAGQMSRIDSAMIAIRKGQTAAEKAGLDTNLVKGSVLASDAFFPFADGLIAAAEAGITAVIQPGGSIRDEEVIEAANDRGIAMIFTGMRHFRH